MVRKKTAESEDNKEKKINEITENKENKQSEAGIPESKEEAPKKDEDLKAGNEPEVVEGKTADKVMPEEKVLEVKLAEMQDKYLRLSAEFDNYRKRTLREKMEISKYAEEELLMKILPLMDDFERALKHIEGSRDCTGIKEGIDLIYLKLSDFLKQQGITEIDTLNNEFNVELHDAVAQVPVQEEGKKGKIVDVIMKGYYLKDKVIRHSKVVIGE